MQIIKLVLFDMDGVLVNSTPEVETFWTEWANKYGVEMNRHVLDTKVHGQTMHRTIDVVFGHLEEKERNKIIAEGIVFDMDMRPPLIKGVAAFIQKLKQNDITIGLVTSSMYERAEKILSHLNIFSHFDFRVSAKDIKRGKPDPEPYLLMSDIAQVPVANCLVFEDSNSGIRSALSAGMNVVAVQERWNEEQQEKFPVQAVIKDFTEISIDREKQLFVQKEGDKKKSLFQLETITDAQ